MGVRKPFTLRDRRRLTQHHLGYRPTNNFSEGDLPAPWAEGDIVEIVDGTVIEPETLRRLNCYPYWEQTQPKPSPVGFYCVTYVPSIGEGDEWYARVFSEDGWGSDRLHIAYADRSGWDRDCNYMAPFRLVDTADPHGRSLRELLIENGWANHG